MRRVWQEPRNRLHGRGVIGKDDREILGPLRPILAAPHLHFNRATARTVEERHLAFHRRADQRDALLLRQLAAVAKVQPHTAEADRGDFQAILDSERMLLDSQLDYYKALAEFTQAIADLERAVGMELPAGTTAPVPVSEGR